MSELTTVARPYAKAAFDFAKDGKSIDKWFDMLQFLSAVQQDKNFKAVQRSLGNSKLVDLLFNICSACSKVCPSFGTMYIPAYGIVFSSNR